MLSIKKCSKVLNQGNNNYTQEQVKDIREVLYQVAEIMNQSKITYHE